jgi:tetratricopeptide (TPR) repeat protein
MVRGQYAYRVAQDYTSAKELMAAVLRENPANEHATYALSTLHRRNLELGDALRYGIQLVKLNPAHGTHWINLGRILELAGDGTHAMKATLKGWRLAQSRILASQLVEQALRIGFPIQDLPIEIQENPYAMYFRSLARKDWAGCMRSAKKLVVNSKILLYYVYKEREMADSARYWLQQALSSSEIDSISYYTGIGDCDHAGKLIDQEKDPLSQTPESQLTYEEIMIECHLMNAHETTATELLRELMHRYPEVDITSIYRNHPLSKKDMDRNPSFKKLVMESPWKPSITLDEFP